MSTCVLVMGRGRSGTSCVAGVLHNMGVNMGERLKEANVNNSMGFFEDLDFLEFHMDLIDEQWENPKIEMSPEQMAKYQQLISIKQEQPLWGVKDPLLCFMFPTFEGLCESAIKVIDVHRPIEQSAQSIVSRSHRWREVIDDVGECPIISMDEAMLICKRYDEAKDESLKHVSAETLYHVDFDQLTKNPKEHVEKIRLFLNLDVSIEKAVEFVSPPLKHQGVLRMFL